MTTGENAKHLADFFFDLALGFKLLSSTGTMVDIIHREQTYIRSADSLGWAFPAPLGAKCAVPDRPVVCFTGDGGSWYQLSELETALRWGGDRC